MKSFTIHKIAPMTEASLWQSCRSAIINLAMASCLAIVIPVMSADTGNGDGKSPHSPDGLFFLLDIDYRVVPQGEKLYCVEYKPAVQKLGKAGQNIFSCWDLATGKCQRSAVRSGKRCVFTDISPKGSWIRAFYYDQEKLLERYIGKSDDEILEVLASVTRERSLLSFALLCPQEFLPVHTWSRPTIDWPDVSDEIEFFVDEDRLGRVIIRRRNESAKPAYTLSVWRIQGQLREELRVPLPGLEDYLIAGFEADGLRNFAVLALEATPSNRKPVSCYLLIYDVRKKAITTKYELGKVKGAWNPLGTFVSQTGSSIFAMCSHDRKMALISLDDKDYLSDLVNPPRPLPRPLDVGNKPMDARELSPNGKYVVYISTRIVIYDIQENRHRLLDTRLEDICKAWEKPPLGSRLWQAVHHPMVQALLPLMKEFMRWRLVRFLGEGDRLLGITEYGKVVVWDIKSGKITNSFRIVETDEVDRILGLD